MEEASPTQSIENFEIIRPLGRGGYSDVFHVKSIETNEEFALKVIKRNKPAQALNRVKNEISIQMKLEHPNIVKLHTSFEDSSFIYLLLEYCSGGELHSYIKQKERLSESETRRLCKQIINGIDLLHSKGIFHRDLKLGNVLLNKNKTIAKIGDFGLAIEIEGDDEMRRTICGTPNYISPEAASRKPYGLASDIWAFGCIVYACLVGKPPFDCPEVKQTLNKVKNLDYSIPDYLSQNAKDLIAQLLSPDPWKRLSTSQIMSHPFFNNNSIPKLQIKTDYCNRDYYEGDTSPLIKTGKARTGTDTKNGSRASIAHSTRTTQSSEGENMPLKYDQSQQVRRSLQLESIQPLSLYNLDPFVHTLNNGYIEITNQGSIKVYIAKRLLEVSSDGQVIFYQGKRYTLKTMPRSAQKLYLYASNCVDVIRKHSVQNSFDSQYI
ncbi:PLK4 [Blepharisma stoltei]|uniref:Uncharacterized protein n=1 Tax=Blepharisma stoltei TaxID=1481888 RepID=A0AAU9IQ10_9CILI|nr:unnamed protein product [Blepharisma stoltei]